MPRPSEELAPGWDIVAQRTNAAWLHYAWTAVLTLLAYPPDKRASVTFTVRNRQSGETRKVTADSREEAAILVMQGAFDKA